MKLKIEKRFMDKYTGFIYGAGKVYDFTKERAEEILKNEKIFATKVEEEIVPKIKEEFETAVKEPKKVEKPSKKSKKKK